MSTHSISRAGREEKGRCSTLTREDKDEEMKHSNFPFVTDRFPERSRILDVQKFV
jgi:hypothetical protein